MTDALSPTLALCKVAEKQWEDPGDLGQFKRLLANRAFGWNESIVDPELPDQEFLEALNRSGMVFVHFGETDPWEVK